MKHYNTQIKRMQALGCAALIAAAIGGTLLVHADQPDTAPVVRVEGGYCVVPGREITREDESRPMVGPTQEEPEQELVMIERDLRVEIPLIKGCVPSAAAETSSVTDETVTPSMGRASDARAPLPEGKAWAAQEAEPAKRYLGRYWCTGYDTCARCCGKTDGVTASGTQATVGRTCAAGKDLPFGTKLYIEGLGERIVEDRGGGVNGAHIDILCQDHAQCYEITGWYEVWIVED